GYGGEGALLGGVSAAGDGQNPVGGAIEGGLGGGAPGGGLSGGRGANISPAPGPAKTVGILSAGKDSGYDPLESLWYHPASVDKSVLDGLRTMTPGEISGISPGMKSQIIQIRKMNSAGLTPTTTADTIDSFQRNLLNAARTGPDQIAAARIGDSLNGL